MAIDEFDGMVDLSSQRPLAVHIAVPDTAVEEQQVVHFFSLKQFFECDLRYKIVQNEC